MIYVEMIFFYHLYIFIFTWDDFDLIFITRSEMISLRSEREKFALEANFAREKLDRFMKEFEHQVISSIISTPHLSSSSHHVSIYFVTYLLAGYHVRERKPMVLYPEMLSSHN